MAGIVDCYEPGVYVVAIMPIADEIICCDEVPVSTESIKRWISYVPNMTLNNLPPTTESLTERLKGFLMPDETILYFGQTGNPLKNRIKQYYNTSLGDSGPHKGSSSTSY